MSKQEHELTEDEVDAVIEEMIEDGRIETRTNHETGEKEVRLTQKGVKFADGLRDRTAPVEIEPALSKYDATIVVQALGILANISIRDGCDRKTALLAEAAVSSGSAVIELVLSPAQIHEINEDTLSRGYARDAARRQSPN